MLTLDRINSVTKLSSFNPWIFKSTLLGGRTLPVYGFRFDLVIFYLGFVPSDQYGLAEISVQWLSLASDFSRRVMNFQLLVLKCSKSSLLDFQLIVLDPPVSISVSLDQTSVTWQPLP